jgi:hypothetical protein
MRLVPAAAPLFLLAPSLTAAAPNGADTGHASAVQKLGYYIGSWKGHGETKAGPFGPAGKLSSSMTCSWFAGRLQVVCRGEEMGPTGKRQFLNILAYDEATKAYTEYSISSRGESEYDRNGSIVGNKLRFVIDQDVGGKPAKFRYTEQRLSPALMTYEAEVSVAAAAWRELAAGEIRKVK